MPGFIDYASAILSASEMRVQTAAHNLSNTSTPGYKRQAAFSSTLEQCSGNSPCAATVISQVDFRQGQLKETGQPLDLALSGPALLQLRDGDELFYSRGGSFSLREGGLVADPLGRLQRLLALRSMASAAELASVQSDRDEALAKLKSDQATLDAEVRNLEAIAAAGTFDLDRWRTRRDQGARFPNPPGSPKPIAGPARQAHLGERTKWNFTATTKWPRS